MKVKATFTVSVFIEIMPVNYDRNPWQRATCDVEISTDFKFDIYLSNMLSSFAGSTYTHTPHTYSHIYSNIRVKYTNTYPYLFSIYLPTIITNK